MNFGRNLIVFIKQLLRPPPRPPWNLCLFVVTWYVETTMFASWVCMCFLNSICDINTSPHCAHEGCEDIWSWDVSAFRDLKFNIIMRFIWSFIFTGRSKKHNCKWPSVDKLASPIHNSILKVLFGQAWIWIPYFVF